MTRCGRRGCSACWPDIEGQDLRLDAETEALEAAEKLIGPCGLDDDAGAGRCLAGRTD